MIYIAVCDDEKYMLDKLTKLIYKFFHQKNIEIKIVQFLSGEKLLNFKSQIDILFLDIKMKNIDGMETAKKLRSINFKGFLIFVTILKEFVFEAFEVQAFDYLVKPIEENYFNKTMTRLLNVIQSSENRKLFIHIGNENKLIDFDEIVYCEVINRKVYLHLQSSEIINYYDKIENLEKKLDENFFKCHRSYLINLKYLYSFKNNIAYMNNGENIPVSRLRYKEFTNAIMQYMKRWRE